jgi:hypothetical protein
MMFAGHYGPGFAARTIEKRVPLWVLFIAVQFLDVLRGIFVLLGIEKVRIVPGITATNPLDLYYMPWTHSLVGALFWSVVAGLVYRLWRGGEGSVGRGSLIVGAAVFSHWILDRIVAVRAVYTHRRCRFSRGLRRVRPAASRDAGDDVLRGAAGRATTFAEPGGSRRLIHDRRLSALRGDALVVAFVLGLPTGSLYIDSR